MTTSRSRKVSTFIVLFALLLAGALWTSTNTRSQTRATTTASLDGGKSAEARATTSRPLSTPAWMTIGLSRFLVGVEISMYLSASSSSPSVPVATPSTIPTSSTPSTSPTSPPPPPIPPSVAPIPVPSSTGDTNPEGTSTGLLTQADEAAWAPVVQCESGGVAADGPNYYGLLGISGPSWAQYSAGLGFPASAYDATLDQQIYVAKLINGAPPDESGGCVSW